MKNTTITATQRRRVQRAFEEQGWMVIASNRAMPERGTVLGCINYSYGRKGPTVPGPMLVIGSATREEWEAQQRNYGEDPASALSDYSTFFKVVAE